MDSDNQKKLKLILGSQSPRRQEFLKFLKIPFQVVVSNEEEHSSKTTPEDFAIEIAREKSRLIQKKIDPWNSFLITADTVVAIDDRILGKPKNLNDARQMLLTLSGRTHQVITAVVFAYPDLFANHKTPNQPLQILQCEFFCQTAVTFAHIDEVRLEQYLSTGDSLDKAGSYGIQGPSLTFIETIQGSYSNVVGFPLDQIYQKMVEILSPATPASQKTDLRKYFLHE